ncbi:exodeoxyribonuclease III [Owenweeksia hongkongensis DSM 17368]|uniref:Exodeoxyribonuclease III n=1 Tax=Owenweeksia hongkongensis (strain DSM 17368 / CIP 108786 / JCM 12287 / NRRL B-23963 / UST20020801) TaxID=926562 RepID=G8QZI1_OWEHD|nr:exodeoxyribonuclease III [Owenweeksia hongkongensis]AEV33634.1 exodeoxyribonuclease III [Owenweeksia hongkongensis DSM 17368]
MKVISYNVNGIRAAVKKGLMEWLQAANPDVLCLQETKAQPEQIDHELIKESGYHGYYHSAQKKGYSGVAILTKTQPDHVEIGCGIEYIDLEGRIIRADYGNLSIMSVYIPSGTNMLRQGLKMQFLADFQKHISELLKERPNLIVCGDYNICHKAIDIHNPIQNANSSGFLPEEREWVSGFIDSGFIDSFRYFNQEPHNYSWWSYRANARNNNKGWRIDYNMASTPLEGRLKRAAILPEAKHSDHCPVLLELD